MIGAASASAMKLHGYFRSSASYRVRIALALKGLPYDYVAVNLPKHEQSSPAYAARVPAQLVPLLEDGEIALTQSLAIVEYLDETHPQPPLLPRTPVERARVRSLALDVACEIHPLNNLRVLRYLVHELKVPDEAKNGWYRHWVETGLQALERRLAGDARTGTFCHGDAPSLADVCLVPQIFNAQRFDCRLDDVPTVMRVFGACMALPAFDSTQPSRCPDAS
jgi:maleylacetoacetate isomerase